MLDFKQIELSDYERIVEIVSNGDNMNCGFSFANLFLWQKTFGTQFALADGFLIIRINNFRYAFTGKGDWKRAFELIKQHAEGNAEPFSVICDQFLLAKLNEAKNDGFEFSVEPSLVDYLYLRSNFVTFAGNRFKTLRGYVNHFKRENDWHCEPITAENINDCLAFEEKWTKNRTKNSENCLFYEDHSVAMRGLQLFEALHLSGILLRVNGEVAGYVFGQPITNNTFDFIVGRADINLTGSYATLYSEFAKTLPETVEYINMEDDCGVAGLRTMKLHYHPILLLERNLVSFL